MRRFLVISHACVTSVNQRLFAAIQQRTGWEVTLVVPESWRNEVGALQEAERDPTFPGRIITRPVALRGNIPLHVYRAWWVDLLRELDPHAIYVHHEPYGLATGQVYLANRLVGGRPIGFYAAQNLLKRYPLPIQMMERYVFARTDFAFPVTRSALEVLRGRGYRGPATVVPLGVDPHLYAPLEDPAPLRRRLGAKEGEFLVGYVGRLTPEKGLQTLLEALAGLPHLPWRLAVLGSGPYEAEFDERARREGLTSRIVRLGYVPHVRVPRYLAALDVLVLPSETRTHWAEQFGRVLIEALACGTPVVGSSSGAIPEVVRQSGGGLVFRERDPRHLAQQLARLLQDHHLRRRLADTGRRAVLERYTVEALAIRMAEAVDRAVVARNGRPVPRPGRTQA